MWRDRAACRDADPRLFEIDGAGQHPYAAEANTYCNRCPVRRECLADAVEHKVTYTWRGGRAIRGPIAACTECGREFQRPRKGYVRQCGPVCRAAARTKEAARGDGRRFDHGTDAGIARHRERGSNLCASCAHWDRSKAAVA